MDLNSSVVSLNSNIRLRREYFGGLVYDTINGNILEVDKNAFEFLNLVKGGALKIDDVIKCLVQNKVIKKVDKSIDKTLQELFNLNIIEKRDETSLTSFSISKKSNKTTNYKPWLSAPEVVHWAVTYSCNKDCPDCYTKRFSSIKNELDTQEALQLIDKIVQWNVFQVAIGGGEPFQRKDLSQLVHHAATQGLSVHITTGKLSINYNLLESISPYIKSLQLGLQSDDLVGKYSKESIKQIKNICITSQRLGITPGVNLFLSKSILGRLESLVKVLIDIGFKRIIFLRYKPSGSIKRWKKENPNQQEIKELYKRINSISKENPQLNIRVDCSLSFVQRYLSKELAKQFGIKGCVAANRILAIAPDGSVYPCSQLIHTNCYAGNLLKDNSEEIWNQSSILRKYRFFRTKKSFIHSWCGICKAKDNCGGCSVAQYTTSNICNIPACRRKGR